MDSESMSSSNRSIYTWLDSNTSLKSYSWVFACVCAVRICTCLSVFVFTLRVITSIFCLPAGFFTQEGSIGFALGASQGFNPAPDSCKNTHVHTQSNIFTYEYTPLCTRVYIDNGIYTHIHAHTHKLRTHALLAHAGR